MNDAPCGYVAFEDDGNITAVNNTLLSMLGYGAGELLGQSVERLLPVGSRIFYQTHLFPLVRLHGRAEEIFLIMRAKDGEDIAFLLNAVRRQKGDRCVIECVLMRVIERRKFEEALLRAKKEAEDARASADAHRQQVQDANEQLEEQALELEMNQHHLQEQAEELELQSEALQSLNSDLVERTAELEHQRLVADEANKAKSSFLAVMSHELRTPLNAIGGYVQLLEMEIQGPITAAQADALSRVSRSQRHLLRLINDVLNLARVEAGRLDYSLQNVEAIDIVNAVVPMIEPQLTSHGLRFELRVQDGICIYCDRDKTEQILLNILSNAVKFTDAAGLISLQAIHEAKDQTVKLIVRDTGVGIPRDHLGQMFEPFVQVDTSHTRRSEGTGLGLTISRDLARGMGGDISVESVEGVGSTFTIVLPSKARIQPPS